MSRSLTSVSLALVIALVSSSGVHAHSPQMFDAEQVVTDQDVLDLIVDQMPESAPDPADNVRTSDDAVVAFEGGTLTLLSSDVEEPIAFVADSGIVSIIGLPDEGLDEGTVEPDGTITFSGDLFGLATRPMEGGGVQTVIAIDGPDAPTEYHFDLEVPADTQYRFFDDGSFLASLPDGTLVGGLSAPWAFDAEGVPVATRYVLTDGGVTQIVDHASGSYTYPILADPCWTCFLDGIAAVAGTVIGVAGVFSMCNVVCAVAGLAVAVYSAGRWVQSNYRSCRGVRQVNPWRAVYWGCR